ncbi:MAG: hypothetical protein PCFJNLEI_02997 [Verrucomicrobiae bacterium]|nr:hypothetical protein [Verrucomicrobiae bacterium]
MNPRKLLAAILITVGTVVLAYQGITFKSPGKPVDVLGVRISTTKTNYIPPVAGALCLVGGVVLLLVKKV